MTLHTHHSHYLPLITLFHTFLWPDISIWLIIVWLSFFSLVIWCTWFLLAVYFPHLLPLASYKYVQMVGTTYMYAQPELATFPRMILEQRAPQLQVTLFSQRAPQPQSTLPSTPHPAPHFRDQFSITLYRGVQLRLVIIAVIFHHCSNSPCCSRTVH